MLQLANVSKWFVWISTFPFSALVYLATYSQLPPTSAAKISVHILEILQPASSKHIFLGILDPYPICKKILFLLVSISLVSAQSFLLVLAASIFFLSHLPYHLGAVMWKEKWISTMEGLKNNCRLWKYNNFKASPSVHIFRLLVFLNKCRMKLFQVFKFLFKNPLFMLLTLILAL